MPTLEIRRAGLAPEYATATIDYLISVLIWPAECDERVEFMRTCAVGRMAALGAAVPAMLQGIAPEDLLEAMPSRVLGAWMEPRIYRGAAAGEFYATAVARRELGQLVSIASLREAMTTPDRRRLHPGADIGDTTLEGTLRDFRAVAHLGATDQAGQLAAVGGANPARPHQHAGSAGRRQSRSPAECRSAGRQRPGASPRARLGQDRPLGAAGRGLGPGAGSARLYAAARPDRMVPCRTVGGGIGGRADDF